MNPVVMLSALLEGLVPVPVMVDRTVTSLSLDSRTVVPGSLFMALTGSHHDGRRFIADAVARGAVAILAEAAPTECLDGVPILVVSGLRALIGPIADRFFGKPSAHLAVIGVTGTNGKTTTSHLIAHALNHRLRCALIGTLGNGFPGALLAAERTTPDAVSVHRWLARFRAEGAQAVALEVSSHALDQGRIGGVRVQGAVFTNLTRDHLDYHIDMKRYGEAKAKLFVDPGLAFAVLNQADRFSYTLAERLVPHVKVFWYGPSGDVQIVDFVAGQEGLTVSLKTSQGPVIIKSALFGRFNVDNLAAALASLLAMGWSAVEAAAALGDISPVKGRMERLVTGAGHPLVVIDYAHTPDAIEQAIRAVRAHSKGQVICVFGCGGDRDAGKRPLMGECAARLADYVVITSDNPRHEDPHAIVEDILSGVAPDRRAMVEVVMDRTSAIQRAFRLGTENDVILVAGKGHEEYQQFGDRCIPYSDRQTVRQLVETL